MGLKQARLRSRRSRLANAARGLKRHLKARARALSKRNKRRGFHLHNKEIIKYAIAHGRVIKHPRRPRRPPVITKPDWPPNIKFMASVPELFSKKHYSREDSGDFKVPECFSLMDNYEESFDFLKRLFVVLYKGQVAEVTFDYGNCKRIDVDASICMDVLLAEYSRYLKQCNERGHTVFPAVVRPLNLERKDIVNLLFSIGAYRNVAGLTIEKPDGVEPLPVLINTQGAPDIWKKSELHLTEIVEYIKRCLERLGKELTINAETEFYKVIGEVMSNAEEHSTMPHRFALGYFKEDHNEHDEIFGVLNFTIFNFGDTIYQTFKNPNCPNKKAVKQMSDLSDAYTKKGWFRKAEFEEETLWTLYSLQDGVTSKPKKRGNGSIQFINNFFRLKGDDENDNQSKMVILSGNTRIIFDGTYKIVEKESAGKKGPKMITFNDSGDISQLPDRKYVSFAPYFFPGTLISARILIKSNILASK